MGLAAQGFTHFVELKFFACAIKQAEIKRLLKGLQGRAGGRLGHMQLFCGFGYIFIAGDTEEYLKLPEAVFHMGYLARAMAVV
jgi:hypothetical protein